MQFLVMLVSVLCSGFLAVVAVSSEEPTCTAGEACKSKYYWPHMHGHPDYYGNPPWPQPTDLQKSFAWRWNGPTGELYAEAFNGAVIDDKKNIYVNGDWNVYKLSPDGRLIWRYAAPGQAAADCLTLYDGVVFADASNGYVFAIDMETGMGKWSVKASASNGGQYSGIAAHNGVLMTQGDAKECPGMGYAQRNVHALNVSNGAELWMFEGEGVLWDWFPQFPDDDSVIFMDHQGMVYRMGLKDGTLMWKNGGIPGTWTDGCQFVANNGLVYGVAIDKMSAQTCRMTGPDSKTMECDGYVTALKISDGTEVWKQRVQKPPNTSPVVGRLGKDSKLTVVMPIGQQTGGCEPDVFPIFGKYFWWLSLQWQAMLFGYVIHPLSVKLGRHSSWMLTGKCTTRNDIVAFDADTGRPEWTWEGPTDHFCMAPGDKDGYLRRSQLGLRPISCPTPWAAPRIGPDGTIYAPNQNGEFYAMRDANGDNKFDKEEISIYDTEGVFTHIGTAHAPGMIVAINFDSVFVFKS